MRTVTAVVGTVWVMGLLILPASWLGIAHDADHSAFRAFGMSLLLLSVIVVLARRTRLRRLFGPASEPGPAATTPVPDQRARVEMTDTALPGPPRLRRPVGHLRQRPAILRPGRRLRWPYLAPGRAVTLCVLGYFVIAVLIYLPVGPFDARALPIAGPNNPAASDPFQMTWFLAWVPFALTHGLSIFHTNYIDYPTGVNLADNTTVPLLGDHRMALHRHPRSRRDLQLPRSDCRFCCSATSMFFVMRRWCSSVWAPSLAGLLYAFGPYTAAQELHLDLTFIPFPPCSCSSGTSCCDASACDRPSSGCCSASSPVCSTSSHRMS